MNLAPVTEEDFIIVPPVENGTVTVNIMEYQTKDSSVTDRKTVELPVENGRIVLGEEMAYVAVLNRYGKGTKALGIVKNFGLEVGAVASTVSHDSHNLTMVYFDPKDAMVAANELIACGGGMTAVKDGEVLNTLRLEVGGLMTKLDAEELTVEAAKMKEIERGMGITVPVNPLLRIVSLALPVVPYVKLTDLGMVDTTNQTMIPLFAE
jgi:adenine deaminase